MTLADRIERAIDPEHCNYGPDRGDGVPCIIVNLKASEWRAVIKALRGDVPQYVSVGMVKGNGEFTVYDQPIPDGEHRLYISKREH